MSREVRVVAPRANRPGKVRRGGDGEEKDGVGAFVDEDGVSGANVVAGPLGGGGARRGMEQGVEGARRVRGWAALQAEVDGAFARAEGDSSARAGGDERGGRALEGASDALGESSLAEEAREDVGEGSAERLRRARARTRRLGRERRGRSVVVVDAEKTARAGEDVFGDGEAERLGREADDGREILAAEEGATEGREVLRDRGARSAVADRLR